MVSVKEIKELREKTGAGMMDCKKALIQCNGDEDQAIVFLRKQGLASIGNRAGKIASEGAVGCYIHAGNKIGVIVEVNCETAPVARNPKFKELADELALHIAAMNPQYVSRGEIPTDVFDRETEIALSSITGNKPPEIIEKIVKGRLEKFYKEVCLVDQAFVRDTNMSVNDLIGALAIQVKEKISVKKFVRFEVGAE